MFVDGPSRRLVAFLQTLFKTTLEGLLDVSLIDQEDVLSVLLIITNAGLNPV